MDKGRILLLNGPSSAGKTTLAKEPQAKAPGYWYCLPFDSFLDTVPSRLWDQNEEQGVRTAFDLHHKFIKLVSDQGKDVIVDTVICAGDIFASFANIFAGYPVILVKVTCPVEELKRREIARGDRDIGLAAGQAALMAPWQGYDLTVDTHAESTEECARRMMEWMENHPHPTAFAALTANPDRWANGSHPSEKL